MIRIPFTELRQNLEQVLLKYAFTPERAQACAQLFAEASRDGVASHGLNRFPRFISYLEKGYIRPQAEPSLIRKLGNIEQWEGNLGPGNLNAQFCMGRAMALARESAMGLITLRHTNHWMRGGSYGWQAAEAGLVGICWTNTQPNMPAWGSTDPILGNNPLIIAIPRAEGPLVLDMAMSQFSFGKLESYRRQGKALPVPGGFDSAGQPSQDPGAIESSGRALPIGYWKGSGLTLMLDALAALLSMGLSTFRLGEQSDDEYNLSQVFLALDPSQLGDSAHSEAILSEMITQLHQSSPAEPGGSIFYPGERTLRTRQESLAKGVPVDEGYWEEVQGMLG